MEFWVEQKVDHARHLLKTLVPVLPDRIFQADGKSLFPPGTNPFKSNPVLDDYRVIKMLEEALLINPLIPLSERHDHWCQFFTTQTDLLRMLETRFADHEMLEAELSATTRGTP